MQSYQIDPVDTLFFRDGKPFSMEDDTVAQGLFPPPPSVLYGVLRTAYAAGQNVSYNRIREDTKHLQIKHLAYRFNYDQYYPAPLDLVIPVAEESADGSKPLARVLPRVKANKLDPPFLSNLDWEELLLSQEYVNGVASCYISAQEWRAYLNAEREDYYLLNPLVGENRHFYKERKVGIGRHANRRVTEEGKLYRIEMQRAINFGVLIGTNVPTDQELSMNLRCGAEGKVAQLRVTEMTEVSPLTKTDTAEFKLVLTSPSFFATGHLPDFSQLPAFRDFSIQLLTASVGRKQGIGGFDMVLRRPKPLQFAVPAGSVYYCRLRNGAYLRDLLNHPDLPTSISASRGVEGFGLYQLGKLQTLRDD